MRCITLPACLSGHAGSWPHCSCTFCSSPHSPSRWPSTLSYSVAIVLLVAFNGFLHFRLWSGRPLTWRWTLGMNAVDVALVTSGVWIAGGFSALFTHLLYYPSLAMFAVLFTSLRLNLAWATLVALVY